MVGQRTEGNKYKKKMLTRILRGNPEVNDPRGKITIPTQNNQFHYESNEYKTLRRGVTTLA